MPSIMSDIILGILTSGKVDHLGGVYLLGKLWTSAKRGAPSSHATRAPLAVKLMA
jgi:hypothetical protein